ncbi:MFS transporter [Halosolutus gelatinilyticus]|uniref:MFS transporter n=1 Tax=Halosolutus gelatinilyticus TaxID=2931975 RepID=UPI003CE5BA78
MSAASSRIGWRLSGRSCSRSAFYRCSLLLFVPATAMTGSFVAVSLLLGIALFTIQPLQQAAVAEHSPPGTRELSFGYAYLAIFGVGALGAGIAGALLTYASPSALFTVLAAFAATGATAAFALLRAERR